METQNTIAQLNDNLRINGLDGEILITQTIAAMTEETRNALIKAVRTFDAFSEANDPYGEHDFGSISLNGDKYFWKIDYFNKAKDAGSENPSDPSITHRVMTIMLASEY